MKASQRQRILLCLLLLLCAFFGEAAGKYIVVLDAGHGGHDPGAVGRSAKEKNINLAVVLELGRLIETNCKDVQVVYTRKTDVFVPLQRRAQIANSAKADLFISVHTNSLAKGKVAYGAETYTLGMARAKENLDVAKRENSVIQYEENYNTVYAGFDPNKSESYIIFEFIQDTYMEQSVELARYIQRSYVTNARRQNKGVHQAGFLVLREVSMPAVLTELGFISTRDEEQYLASSSGQKKLAESIYRGFLEYYNQQNSGGKATVSAPAAVPVQSASSATTAEVSATTAAEEGAEGEVVYKVQFLVSDKKLASGAKELKGLTGADYYMDGSTYKYTYGATTSYDEALRLQRKVRQTFPDAFMVKFQNGQRIK